MTVTIYSDRGIRIAPGVAAEALFHYARSYPLIQRFVRSPYLRIITAEIIRRETIFSRSVFQYFFAQLSRRGPLTISLYRGVYLSELDFSRELRRSLSATL